MKETIADFRVEKDSIGTKDVPENVYYGVQSLRAAENFHITGLNMHPRFSRRKRFHWNKGCSGKCLLRSTVFAGSREFSYNRIKYASGNY